MSLEAAIQCLIPILERSDGDLVAHCGTQEEGSYLYTLTLTDIATDWTECLPLLGRGQEAVIAALKRVRHCWPPGQR